MSIVTLLTKRISNYDNRDSVGARFRARRIAPLRAMIVEVYERHGAVSIVDIGGTERYWNIIPRRFLDDHNVNITIVNLPGCGRPADHGPFRFVDADGCDLASFASESFHIAHSNSVVEHVGDWNRMVQFAKELSRVSQRYFVQTPSFWFPVEPHFLTPFFHWLPKPTRVWLVLHARLGHWDKASSIDEAVRAVESARLLNKKMFQELFADADVLTERFLWLPKSFIAVKR
ncbi:MAG: methyltransferase domain-containing protein [Gemmatimonadales bacterium]